jgi:hypothetical protein
MPAGTVNDLATGVIGLVRVAWRVSVSDRLRGYVQTGTGTDPTIITVVASSRWPGARRM